MAAPTRCFSVTPISCFFESYFTVDHPDRAPCNTITFIESDTSPDHKHIVAWLEGGVVQLELRDHVLASFTTATPGITATWVCPRFDHRATTQSIHLYTVEGGAVYVRKSTTGIGGFGARALIAATGSTVTACHGLNRINYVYWLDGTAVKGRRYDAAGNALEAAFTAIATVDAIAPAATCAPIKAGGHRVILWYVSAGVKTFKTSIDGITFV